MTYYGAFRRQFGHRRPTPTSLAVPATAAVAAALVALGAAHPHPHHHTAAAASSRPRHSSPRANEALGERMAADSGWHGPQWTCLDELWTRESGWRTTVWNYQDSGAYGIPQALPASKMAAAGPHWKTSARTQIRWGLRNIRNVYGTPCTAWNHELANGWY